MNVRMVTVFRPIGPDGEPIAHGVAEELGFRYRDEEVIQQAARAAGVPLEAMVSAEHAFSFKQGMVDVLTGSRTFTSRSRGTTQRP